MINIKTAEEIQRMRESAQILSKVHGAIAASVQAGISGLELDCIAEKAIQDHGAQPSFKGLYGFPACLCFSVNDEVVHGKPTAYKLKKGDIVTIDCGVIYQGFHSDSAFTYNIGRVSKELLHLLATTQEAMYQGIAACKVGNRTGDVGYAIQQHVEKHGYGIVKEYTGHGIGRKLHEEPTMYNYGKSKRGLPIQEGMVIAIEPIVTLGSPDVYEVSEWEVRTNDGSPACHFEHTVAIVNGQAEVLTTFDYIRKANEN